MASGWRSAMSEDDATALHWLDATALGARFRSGSLRPSQLLRVLLERIDRLDPLLAVFVCLDRTGAIAAACAADARFANATPLGPLDGIPVGIKDVIDVAGLPTTCHSRLRLDAIAAQDATCVARLRAGGAVILGKLATHEFAIGGPAFDLPFPPARNPWNREHHPGGSSSGAGAGVAAGLFPLAIGTDTAGSIRNPAGACGVVGLKPGYDCIPRDGVVPLAWSLDHVGFLARSARDCALAFAVLAGVRCTVEEGVSGLRVGYVRHFHEVDMAADNEVAAALDAAAARLAGAGAVVRDVKLPPLDKFAVVNRVLLQAEGFCAHADALRTHPDAFSALTRKALLPGAFHSADDVLRTMRWRGELARAVDTVLAEVDVLLCASSMTPPCRIDDPEAIGRTYMAQARTPFNLTGHPALAMRSGQSANGLPLSLQFAAGHGRESELLRAAAGWERLGGGFVPPPI